MLRFLALSAVLSVAIAAPEVGKSNRVALDVYYESLCPDSRNFLVNQLAPKWQYLSTFVDLRLIPFGKATYSPNSAGGWDFSCQHGASECAGNILHACGIKYSKDVTQALNFASCLMRAPTSGAQCAALAELDYTPIDACSKTVEGQNLVQQHGVETLTLKPTLTFVPWVIMDKNWEDSKQWNSLANLGSVVCSHVRFSSPACSANLLL